MTVKKGFFTKTHLFPEHTRAMEIPPDVAAEVDSVLNAEHPWSHLVMYTNGNGMSCAFILGNKCTEEELRELGVSDDQLKNSSPVKRVDFDDPSAFFHFIGMVFALRFRSSAIQRILKSPWERRNT